MALYQNQSDFTYSNSAVFSTSYAPSSIAPYGGIYKCIVCGHEIGIARGHVLPPQNHHQHPNRQPIRWQAVAIHN